MYLENIIRNRIVVSLVSIFFGIVLIIRQRAAVDSLVMILGIVLLINAAAFLLMYFFGQYKLSSQLISGIFLGIVGLFFFIRPDLIVNLFPVVMGIILIQSGLIDLRFALALPKEEKQKVWLLIFSVLIVVSGAIALFHPAAIADALILYAGICMVVNGVFCLVIMLLNRSGQR